jgi:PAS domain S-box-containing protein
MPIDPDAKSLQLRTALRDLVALSTIPAAWVGREPPTIAAGLADVLVGTLHLDFAFVRLCDPNGVAATDVTRGNGWNAFPEWLQHHLAAVGQCSRREIIPDVGGGMKRCRGLLIPIGANADGGLVAIACDRPDFPTETDQLLLSVAANHAATAFQNARLIHERRRAEEKLRKARDELEVKVAERTAELRRSEAYSAEAQRLSHTGSFGWKVSNGEIVWSEETYRIAGYDLATKPSLELILQRIHPEDVAFVQETIERASQAGTDLDLEHRYVVPGGSVKYVHVMAQAVRDEKDNLEYVGALMDVTERKQADDALHQTQAELAHVTRVMTMGELVASIAHEVNQPLGAIVTNGSACLRLLSREVPDLDKSREVIDRMISDGMRASEVIKRIRDLLHKSPTEKVPLDINETIQEVIALVSSDVIRSKVELKAELADDLPPVTGDRIQLQQVILNLILNGKEAMSGMQLRPRELLVSSGKGESDEVVVAVRDSGQGLEMKDVEQIFEPFFTTKSAGMGLGLSISRTIIEAHGGTLWATQNEDKGATIQFTLPPQRD